MENKDKLPKNSDRQTYRQPDNQAKRHTEIKRRGRDKGKKISTLDMKDDNIHKKCKTKKSKKKHN